MGLPTGKQETEFTPIPAGNHMARVKGIDLDIYNNYQAVVDGEQLKYQGVQITWDIDGLEWREKYVRLSTAPNATFYNRIEALHGVQLQDDFTVEWDVSEQANTDIAFYPGFQPDQDDPEKGHVKGQWIKKEQVHDGIVGHVNDLKVNGESIIGKSCFLNVKVKQNGYNKVDQGGATPLPANMTAPPPVAQTAQVEAAPE